MIKCVKHGDSPEHEVSGRCSLCVNEERASVPWVIEDKNTAKSRGSSKYYTGRTCKRGHVSQRYVSTGICIKCNQENAEASRTRAVNEARGGFVSRQYYVHHDDVAALSAIVESMRAARK